VRPRLLAAAKKVWSLINVSNVKSTPNQDDRFRCRGIVVSCRSELARQTGTNRVLVGEIARAELVDADVTHDVVTMNSWVEFRYSLTDQIRRAQLVYPAETDISMGKISVMTPIGAALIGLSEGQSIEWRTLQGDKRDLTVLKVHSQVADIPFLAGQNSDGKPEGGNEGS
jgi:regulator of nucleoside diphosphate kinase